MSERTSAARTSERPEHPSKSNGRTVKISSRYGKLTPAQVKRAVESVTYEKR